MGDGLSAADVRSVVDASNGSNGYPYPVYTNGNNSGFDGNGDWVWLILILALCGNGFGFGGFGGGFGGFGMGMDFMYPWLANGQQQIMTNTNDGFDNLHLSNQIEGVRDGISGISTQLCDGFHGVSNAICNSTANVTNAITNGFYNAEISANNRQMADMQQNFNNQVTTLQGFNNLNNALQQCCCDNRLATCQTQNIVQNEANATRFADANNTRDIITNATANTQAILDKLCQLELDGVKAQVEAKNDKINDLQRELSMADLRASQTAQNAFIAQGFANEVDQLYNRLNNCPVPSTPVYGRTPIFTCNNNGCGCGCNGI
jgi:hypothetical protein